MRDSNGELDTYGSDFASLDFEFECEDAVPCMLCPATFTVANDEQPLLNHLYQVHRLIIGEVEQVADLRQYVMYWGKLRDLELSKYCVVIKTNSEVGARAPPQTFYLLSHKLPEDNKLRVMLKQMKLKFLVEQKELERRDTSFSRQCIYCSEVVTGGVANCFHHLTFRHGFTLGNPDNMVNGAKLLDLLYQKLRRLECLYCEKVFKDHVVLRQHMRKQNHRGLNPKNKMYDKFYLLNYLKPGVPWEEAKRNLEEESDCGSVRAAVDEVGERRPDELGWTDWKEDDSTSATCLFCPFTTTQVPLGLFSHMSVHHKFEFKKVTQNFSFYQKVKMVNYIRKCVGEQRCLRCHLVLPSHAVLLDHLVEADHYRLPCARTWNLPQYHFPVIENDGLLCHLEDGEMASGSTGGSPADEEDERVYAEEVAGYPDSILLEEKVRQEIIRTEEVEDELYGAVQCLFCGHTVWGDLAYTRVLAHMLALHCFNFPEVVTGLSFYTQVKLVNYIRSKTHRSECYMCSEVFEGRQAMEEHRVLANHLTMPQPHLFQDNRWLQPVLEADGFLHNLREAGDSDDEDPSQPSPGREAKIYCEEIKIPESILSNRMLREELLDTPELSGCPHPQQHNGPHPQHSQHYHTEA